MANLNPVTPAQRSKHQRYQSTIPTPSVGGIVSFICLARRPACPFVRLVCKLRKSRIRRKEDPGAVRCIYYAPPTKNAIRLIALEKCYFYDEWRRVGIERG